MAFDLTTSTLCRIAATLSAPMYAGTAQIPGTVSLDLALANGTGANQNNMAWWDANGSVGIGAFDNLDLTSLAQLDEDAGTLWTVVFSKIKSLLIYNKSTSGYMRVGGGTDGAPAADAWIGAAGEGWLTADADKLDIPPGGVCHMVFPPAAGVSVGGGNNILCLAGVTAVQSYEIILTGIGTAS